MFSFLKSWSLKKLSLEGELYYRKSTFVQRKTQEKDGYFGIQVNYGSKKNVSKSNQKKFKDNGIEFKNIYDGSKFFMDPKLSMDIQQTLNSDIAMILDSLIDINKEYGHLHVT